MGKQEKKHGKVVQKSNKVHKTLRDKLRKKRQSLKTRLKEKKQKKKLYNPEEQKLKFFSQGQASQEDQKKIKLKKISKYIEKFINIYEDNIDDFYDIFKTFDQKGKIDISGLENKEFSKCLKKIFKYLPLVKQNGEYSKLPQSKMNLENFIRQKVSSAIENYLQYGSQSQSDEESSVENKKEKKQAKLKLKAKQQEEENTELIKIYKEKIALQVPSVNMMGPSIPESERLKLAQMFDQQVLEMKKQQEEHLEKEEDEFNQIFNMGKTRKEIKNAALPKVQSTVPDHLMAEGSAVLGQKVEVKDGYIEEYNKIYRPKKLIDMHKEMKELQGEDKEKRPFSKERDIFGEGRMSMMKNSTFFDFKSRMSKPQTTNQFL